MTLTDVWRIGKDIVSRNRVLFLLPLILDIFFYGPLMSLHGTNIHLKLTLPSSLPSIQNLLPDAAVVTGETATGLPSFSTYPGTILASIFVGIFVSLVVMPYLTGGYLGTIAQDIKNPVEKLSFTDMAGKFFTRFFLIQVLMILALLLLVPLMLIPGLNILLVLGVLIALIVIFFWDYSVVYDDLDVIPALKKAYRVFIDNVGIMATTIIPVAFLLAPLSALTSAVMYTPILILIIALYAYVGAVLVSGFMSLYANLTGTEDTIHQEVPID